MGTATQQNILAAQQKVILSVQKTTWGSPTQMPETAKVDVPIDGVLSSPASTVMTMTTPDVPLPMDVDTPSTISACSTPHPELASSKGPSTTDPQSLSENSMGAPSNPKKKKMEKDEPPRRRQAHQRHSSL